MRKRYALWLALGATVLWLCFIYTRSSKPAVVSDQESGWVLELLQRLIPSVSMRLVRKLAHFTEYAVLGGLLWLDLRLWGEGLLDYIDETRPDAVLVLYNPGALEDNNTIMFDFLSR